MNKRVSFGVAISQEVLGEGAPVPLQGGIAEGMATAAALGLTVSNSIYAIPAISMQRRSPGIDRVGCADSGHWDRPGIQSERSQSDLR